MEWLVAVITIVAGVITVTWFVRDIRKENSKILRSLFDVQTIHTKILEKIEEGQREGFKALSEISERTAEINERGFETLAKILAKIEAK